MNSLAAALVTLLALGGTTQARGDESSFRLKETPQTEEVRARCSICHSTDYIQMNSPFLNRAGWEAEVRKMIKVMGAPIPPEEIDPIIEYLARNYGVE